MNRPEEPSLEGVRKMLSTTRLAITTNRIQEKDKHYTERAREVRAIIDVEREHADAVVANLEHALTNLEEHHTKLHAKIDELKEQVEAGEKRLALLTADNAEKLVRLEAFRKAAQRSLSASTIKNLDRRAEEAARKQIATLDEDDNGRSR